MESEDSGFQLEGNPTSNCRQSSKHGDAKKNQFYEWKYENEIWYETFIDEFFVKNVTISQVGDLKYE